MRWTLLALSLLAVALAAPAQVTPLPGDGCLPRPGERAGDTSLNCEHNAGDGADSDAPCTNATAVNTATPTATATVPAPTATATSTSTGTATATGTVTQTPTATPNGMQGQLFLTGPSNTNTTVAYMSTDNAGNNIENGAKVPMPRSLRMRVMYIHCAAAPGSGKTLTAQLRKNAADISGASCSMANTTDCNVTLTNDATADYAAGDYADIALTQASGSATASECKGTIYYRTSGDTDETDAIIVVGSQASTGVPPAYCGPYLTGASLSSPWGCSLVSQTQGRWLMLSGTLAGFAGHANSWNGNGTTGTFTLLTADGANTTDLTGNLVNSAETTFLDTTCTTGCALTDGSLLNVQLTGDRSSVSDLHLAWNVTSSPQLFTGSLKDLSSSAGFMGPVRSALSALGDVAQPMAKASLIDHLYAYANTIVTSGVFTVWTGSTIGGMAATSITCTIAAGSNVSCNDTSHSVTTAAGDFVGIVATDTNGAGDYAKVVARLNPITANTPTATSAASTATATQTATVTATPTNTPHTATFDVVTRGANDSDCVYLAQFGASYPPGPPTTLSEGGVVLGSRSFFGGTTFVTGVGGLLWNTATLGAGVTLVDATLEMETWLGDPGNADTRNLVGAWYQPAPVTWSTADYTGTPATTAITGVALSSFAASTLYDLTLANVNTTNIDTVGHTAMRLWIDGGQPTGVNSVDFICESPAPRLIVRYYP